MAFIAAVTVLIIYAFQDKIEWCRQQISFRFKLHNIEEMKLKMPKRWLWFFTIIYFIVGFSIAICQAIILSKGNQSTRHWFTDQIIAARFAFAAVLILTGIFSIALMLFPKKRTSNLFCFLFAIVSLVLASIASSYEIYGYNMGNFQPRNQEEFFEHKSRLDINKGIYDWLPLIKCLKLNINLPYISYISFSLPF